MSENRTVFLVLSYLWLLALIPFFMEKDDKEVLWHAKHGLVLTLAEFALWIVMQIILWGVTALIPPLGCLGCFPLMALIVGQLGLHVACIVKAINGERLTIPGLSDFADQF